MEWRNEVVIEFLRLYGKYSVIWDPTKQKNRHEVTDAWNSLKNEFSVDLPVEALKKKKESLMATYRALIRRKSDTAKSMEEPYRPTWFAFETMHRYLKTIRKQTIGSNEEELIVKEETSSPPPSQNLITIERFSSRHSNGSSEHSLDSWSSSPDTKKPRKSNSYDDPLQTLSSQADPLQLSRSQVDPLQLSRTQVNSLQLSRNQVDPSQVSRTQVDHLQLPKNPVDPLQIPTNLINTLDTPRNQMVRRKDDQVQTSKNRYNDSEDDFDVIGKNIANKLRKLPKETEIVAEKLIMEIIFEAQLGNVDRDTKLELIQ